MLILTQFNIKWTQIIDLWRIYNGNCAICYYLNSNSHKKREKMCDEWIIGRKWECKTDLTAINTKKNIWIHIKTILRGTAMLSKNVFAFKTYLLTYSTKNFLLDLLTQKSFLVRKSSFTCWADLHFYYFYFSLLLWRIRKVYIFFKIQLFKEIIINRSASHFSHRFRCCRLYVCTYVQWLNVWVCMCILSHAWSQLWFHYYHQT